MSVKLKLMNQKDQFNEYRTRMNEKILASDNKVLKRYFNLDTNAFLDGALPSKTKELLGLVASVVLRCDDCIKYHLGRCHEVGYSKDEIFESLSIASIIGGTVVIPHLRKAVEYWEELDNPND